MHNKLVKHLKLISLAESIYAGTKNLHLLQLLVKSANKLLTTSEIKLNKKEIPNLSHSTTLAHRKLGKKRRKQKPQFNLLQKQSILTQLTPCPTWIKRNRNQEETAPRIEKVREERPNIEIRDQISTQTPATNIKHHKKTWHCLKNLWPKAKSTQKTFYTKRHKIPLYTWF